MTWEDVDFDANVIRIRRIQERDGSLTEMTKTEAGTREIPMLPKRVAEKEVGLVSFEPPIPAEGFTLSLAFHRRRERDHALRHVADRLMALLS